MSAIYDMTRRVDLFTVTDRDWQRNDMYHMMQTNLRHAIFQLAGHVGSPGLYGTERARVMPSRLPNRLLFTYKQS